MNVCRADRLTFLGIFFFTVYSIFRIFEKTNMQEVTMSRNRRVLFICTANAARSQMAEALLRGMRPDTYDVFSAGTAPTVVDLFKCVSQRSL